MTVSWVLCGAILAPLAAAQTFPTKPIRIVNPFAPGGNTDIVTRAITERLIPVFKQQMIVEKYARVIKAAGIPKQ